MIRVTCFFGISGAGKPFGFSETHWYVAGSTKESARQAAITLQSKRLNICGRNVHGNAVRISKDGVRGDSLLLLPPEIAATAPNSPAGTANQDSDQPNSCLLYRLFSAEDAAGAQRQKALFLAGIPDLCVRTNPPGPNLTAIPGWGAALGDYLSTLKNGSWGFLARTLNPTVKNVLSYTQEVGGTGKLGVVVAPADDLANPGDRIQVRGATVVNPALPSPNGIWFVDSESNPGGGANVTYFLRSSEGVSASNIDFPGQVELVQYSYLAYDALQPRGQTTRKRGVSGWRPHGRSSRRRSFAG